jgi:hypothetical protein
MELADEFDRLVAARGLTDDLESLFLEDLTKIEAYDGLVLSDNNTPGHQYSFLASCAHRQVENQLDDATGFELAPTAYELSGMRPGSYRPGVT